MPSGENMTKLRDHLMMPIGTNDGPDQQIETHQLLLPFDPPMGIEFKVTPKGPKSVQLEIQLKDVAG